MRPPTPFQWLIGNCVVSLVLMLGGLAVIGMWLTGTASGWAALAAVVIASVAARASEKVRDHAAWEREWNGGSRAGLRLPRNWRLLVGLVAWGWLAWLSFLPNAGDPALTLASDVFWLASGLMAVVAVVRFVRLGTSRAGGRAVIVKACLPVPVGSDTVRDAYRAIEGLVR